MIETTREDLLRLYEQMEARLKLVKVPSTVHCDHLIQAPEGAQSDTARAEVANKVHEREGRRDPMTWEIDQKHSYVGFAIKHMVFTTVRGQFHQYRATIDLDETDLTRSRFGGEIDVSSIDTHEPKRDEHLKSADFFDVARFPTIRYMSKRIEAQGGNHFRVLGDLSIHGVTTELEMLGEYAGNARRDPWGTLRTGFSATGSLNRKDYGLVWNIDLDQGGILVGESVILQLDIELVQVEAPPETS